MGNKPRDTGTRTATLVHRTTSKAGHRIHLTDDQEDVEYHGQPAPRFALAILCFVLFAFLAQISVNMTMTPNGRIHFAAGVICFIAIDLLQLFHSLPQAKSLRRRYWVWTLVAQLLLSFVPLVLFDTIWGAAAGMFAGSVLLLLPDVWGWTAFGLTLLFVTGLAVDQHYTPRDLVYYVISTSLTGLIVYGLSRLTAIVVELHLAREQLAKMAVAQERLRFARDLHDLLGYSLSAITLKSEVAIRLVHHHQGRAVDELTSILDISRQALADVRAVASSYRDMSLTSEVEAAAAMLATAEIEVEARVSTQPITGRADTVLATVLREAVTNMLRHSKVQHCLIEVVEHDRTIRLRIVNDGVAEPAPGDTDRQGARDGSGLANLDTRVRVLGGRLVAGVRPDGSFEVLAEVPTDAVRQTRDAGREAADVRVEAA